MCAYLCIQIAKIATIDFFEISNRIKALGYKKNLFILLLVAMAVEKIMKVLLSGPLRAFTIIEILVSLVNYRETIVALRDIRQQMG